MMLCLLYDAVLAAALADVLADVLVDRRASWRNAPHVDCVGAVGIVYMLRVLSPPAVSGITMMWPDAVHRQSTASSRSLFFF